MPGSLAQPLGSFLLRCSLGPQMGSVAQDTLALAWKPCGPAAHLRCCCPASFVDSQKRLWEAKRIKDVGVPLPTVAPLGPRSDS